jgi:hypothetical protein
MPDSLPTQTAIIRTDQTGATAPTVLTRLADIPEEEIWLASQKSERTRRAYHLDVRYFMATIGITAIEELRRIDHRAVIAWERSMDKPKRAAPVTVRPWFPSGQRAVGLQNGDLLVQQIAFGQRRAQFGFQSIAFQLVADRGLRGQRRLAI